MTAITRLPAALTRRPSGGRPHRNLVLDRAQELRLLRTPGQKILAVILLLAFLWLPLNTSDATLNTLCFVGAYAIGAIGLNLLTGFAGQVSLGHAFFFGVGAYTTAYLGGEQGWPFLAYLAFAAALGLLLGAVIGPFALRLRGNYLAVVTIGLVFLGEHVFLNWDSVTGGGTGASTIDADVGIGPLDFRELELGGQVYTREQSLFWLIWGVVGVTALLAKNIARSRPGRAMQAVRDRDLSAEIIGVSLGRTKVGAFAVASAMAAVGGALYSIVLTRANPNEFGGRQGLFLSITFVAMIIIGGIGTIFGSILGALLVGYGQYFIRENTDLAVFDWIVEGGASAGYLSAGELNGVLFGAFIIIFLLVEPRGLAALWLRLKTYFATWPFSY